MRNFHSTKEPSNLKMQVRNYLNGLDYFFMFNQADYNDVLRIIGHIKDNNPKLVKEEPPIQTPLALNDMTPFTLIEQWLGKMQAILDEPKKFTLRPCCILANQAYERALDLYRKTAGVVWTGTDRQLYKYIRENTDSLDYELPSYEAWKRYLRDVKRYKDELRALADEMREKTD